MITRIGNAQAIKNSSPMIAHVISQTLNDLNKFIVFLPVFIIIVVAEWANDFIHTDH
jgi:hypothetical protein